MIQTPTNELLELDIDMNNIKIEYKCDYMVYGTLWFVKASINNISG